MFYILFITSPPTPPTTGTSEERNWVLATNLNFLIPIYDIYFLYFKLIQFYRFLFQNVNLLKGRMFLLIIIILNKKNLKNRFNKSKNVKKIIPGLLETLSRKVQGLIWSEELIYLISILLLLPPTLIQWQPLNHRHALIQVLIYKSYSHLTHASKHLSIYLYNCLSVQLSVVHCIAFQHVGAYIMYFKWAFLSPRWAGLCLRQWGWPGFVNGI